MKKQTMYLIAAGAAVWWFFIRKPKAAQAATAAGDVEEMGALYGAMAGALSGMPLLGFGPADATPGDATGYDGAAVDPDAYADVSRQWGQRNADAEQDTVVYQPSVI